MKKKPVEVGKRYLFEVVNLGYNAEGIARIEGFAVFIPGALTGETVEAEVTEVKNKFANAKLIEVKKPSEYRVNPQCSIYEDCGGCQLMHLAYDKQLEYKKQQVSDQINRNAKLEDIKILDTLGMDRPYNYRNKGQFPVSQLDGNNAIGFYSQGTHQIVNIDKCIIQSEITEDINRVFHEYLKKYNVSAYDESTGNGMIRHIITRVGFKTNEVMVVIVTNGKELPHCGELITSLTDNVDNLKSVVQNINSQNTNKILGNENISLWGQEYIEDYIGNLKFRISPKSFYQVNTEQTEVLYNKALEYAELTGEEVVIDAYCGIGTISLFLAQKAKKVYGIEIVDTAIEDANVNAEINSIQNAEFIVGKSEEKMPELFDQGVRPDVIVMDPPRKGCDEEFLETAVKMQPKRMVYISCNPATLARDLAYLDSKGYIAKEVQPVDMFGHTYHVECVVKIERK